MTQLELILVQAFAGGQSSLAKARQSRLKAVFSVLIAALIAWPGALQVPDVLPAHAESTSVANLLYGVSSVNAMTAWAVGYASATGGEQNAVPVIAATTDAGRTWVTQSVPNGISVPKGVSFVNATTGWAVGYYSASGFSNDSTGVVVATTNAGSSWTLQQVPAAATQLNGVSFVDASHGWAVGYDISNTTGQKMGSILATVDGGATWTVQSAPAGTGLLNSVRFIDKSHGWAVGENLGFTSGVILATVDGGATWMNETVPSGAYILSGVTFVDASAGWVVGRDGPGNPLVLATVDGGASWVAQTMPPGAGTLNSVSFVNTSKGWAVGLSDLGGGYANALILGTTDGGVNWSPQMAPAGATELKSVSFADPLSGWAAGYVSPNGPITYALDGTTDGGSTWNPQTITAGALGGGTPSVSEVDPFPIDELVTTGSAPGNVNTATGSFWRAFTDLAIPGRGIPLNFGRTYDSARANQDGPFGFGWTHSYNVSLTTDPGGNATVYEENGSTVTFAATGANFRAPSRVLASLTRNADGTYTMTRKNQVKLLFSTTGKLLQEADRNGYTTALTYAGGRLTAVSDPAGRSLSVSYGGGTRIIAVTDPSGRLASFTYDTSGNLVSAKDVGGGTTSFGYDAAHHLTSISDPRGGQLQVGYDGSGRTATETDPLLRMTTMSYSPGTTTVTNPDGSIRVDQYSNNELTARTAASGTPVAGTWTFAYDPATLGTLSVRNPDGVTTHNTYDAMGNVLTHSDGLNQTSRYAYDGLNDLLSVTDPIGQQVLINSYDANGNLVQTTRGQVAVSTYAYDPARPEDVLTMTDPNHKVWRYAYDTFGNRISATDPLGNTMTATYDAAGRMIASVSPRGNQSGSTTSRFTTSYSYDPFGDLTQLSDPLGSTTKFRYDANRNLAGVMDANGHQTTHTFNADNEEVVTTRAGGTKLTTAYDSMGRVVRQTDPLNHSVGYGYDARGRLATQSDAFNFTTQYQYSSGSNLIAVIDPRQRAINYGYDAANQMKTITHSDGQTPNASFSYDPDGRRTSMQDGSGTTRYGYDSLSRLIASIDGAGQSIGYGYDGNSNLTTINYPGGAQISRGYDDANHLNSVSDWLHNTTAFTYDADGNLIRESLPNTVVLISAYDPANRLQVIDASNGGTGRFMRFTYRRDAVGDVTAQTQQVSQGATQQTTSSTNTYDALNRVTGVSSGSIQGTATYDGADNLTSRSVGRTSVTSTYDAGHELQDETVSSGSSTTSYTFSYDTNGNRVQRATVGGPTLGYTYDQENRLTQLSTTTYGYNADGLRVSKTNGGGPTQHFTWELGDGVPVLIQDASATYVNGPGGRPIEQIMPDGTVFYLVPDQLGSTEALTSGSGSSVTQYAYPDPYGAVTRSQSGTPQTPFQYAGQYTDAESGQQYLQSRYYDPVSGNYLTRDPQASQSRQPYTYAGDSPFNAVGLGSQLGSLSGTPEPPPSLEQQVRQAAAAGVQGVGDFLGQTHDDLVSADPLHVTLGVANSFLIAAAIMDAAAGVASVGRAILPRVAAEESRLPVLFHYSTKSSEQIFEEGLTVGKSGNVYLTPAGELSPVQAQIELGLPGGRGYPITMWSVRATDVQSLGLRLSGPSRVAGLPGGGAGGGWEVIASGPVPAELLTRVW